MWLSGISLDDTYTRSNAERSVDPLSKRLLLATAPARSGWKPDGSETNAGLQPLEKVRNRQGLFLLASFYALGGYGTEFGRLFFEERR